VVKEVTCKTVVVPRSTRATWTRSGGRRAAPVPIVRRPPASGAAGRVPRRPRRRPRRSRRSPTPSTSLFPNGLFLCLRQRGRAVMGLRRGLPGAGRFRNPLALPCAAGSGPSRGERTRRVLYRAINWAAQGEVVVRHPVAGRRWSHRRPRTWHFARMRCRWLDLSRPWRAGMSFAARSATCCRFSTGLPGKLGGTGPGPDRS